MNTINQKIPQVDPAKFKFASTEEKLHDTKLSTKPIGYLHDAWRRFRKNQASLIAMVIIVFLFLFAILVPIFCTNDYTKSVNDTDRKRYAKLLPDWSLLSWAGWDGASDIIGINTATYNVYRAKGVETGRDAIVKIKKGPYQNEAQVGASDMYDIRVDSYANLGMAYMTFTQEQYEAIQNWQTETGVQVIYPAVDATQLISTKKTDANVWYLTNAKGNPTVDASGNYTNIYLTTGDDGGYHSIRTSFDPGTYRYATRTGTSAAPSWSCRVSLYDFFQYKYGFEPSFVFGSDGNGLDILTRLAQGAQFSFILAISVSVINLFLGAIYGSIEGFFGGAADLIMERVSDILSGVPFIVVTTLFQLHLASSVGVVWSLLFAFVLTGWIGTASTVRMQFYRYKSQEYVMAARTLGAGNARLMFKHIFPNAIGTIITSSVLVIPGVIFSESSLTYLGIVNLDSTSLTSVGTMLANGRAFLSTTPHIILFPAIFISLLMITFNLFGNGLRDAFNPSLRGTED